jgi:deazaflavin-dependent oxidoreductase (nitroreductase family)
MPMDIQEINRKVIEQFRAGGEVEGMHRDRLLLLSTVGRRSGQQRTTPLMFHRQDDRLLVIASNIGAAQHPDWYLNLIADPQVTVEVGDERYPATASTLDGDEHAELWEMLKQQYPFFAEHENKTDRTIPVVALTPNA